MAEYRLQIITLEKTVFDRQVVSIIAPGSEGYLGVLANHAPLLTALGAGHLTVKETPGREYIYKLAGGFLEVSNNLATILADSLEPVSSPEDEK
jgi:F-type H+-transporting ATPase subunit epsilon